MRSIFLFFLGGGAFYLRCSSSSSSFFRLFPLSSSSFRPPFLDLIFFSALLLLPGVFFFFFFFISFVSFLCSPNRHQHDSSPHPCSLSTSYSVNIRRDLDSDAFEEALESFAEDPRHSAADSAVVVVLSHGQEKGIYATDGVVIHFSQILDALDGHNCPALVNKPKLFFFQACRGLRTQRGFDVVDTTSTTNGAKTTNGGSMATSSSAPASGVATPVEEVGEDEDDDPSSSSSSSSAARHDDFYRVDSNGDFAVPHGALGRE